jgi:hypothetical protein
MKRYEGMEKFFMLNVLQLLMIFDSVKKISLRSYYVGFNEVSTFIEIKSS